ncbi:MAG: transposase [Paraglaciecola sp.]|jgi:transposase
MRCITSKQSKKSRSLPVIHPHAAGIDIGGSFHVVAIPPDKTDEPVKTFNAFTLDLHDMAKWLVSHGITTVAMESTSVYWVSVYEILEEYGLEAVLPNARDTCTVPGRRTNVNAAQ